MFCHLPTAARQRFDAKPDHLTPFLTKATVFRLLFLCLAASAMSHASAQTGGALNNYFDQGDARCVRMDDLTGEGRVDVGQIVDDLAAGSMVVGDYYPENGTEARVRKYFLLYKLPPQPEGGLQSATLSISLLESRNQNEANELPPLQLVRVPSARPEWQTGEAREKFSPSLFTDPNLDEPPVDIADKTTPAGPLEIDVTEAVRKAYAEADDAAVLFRFDVATDGFDLSDQFSNAYVLAGPGIGKLSDKHRAPALEVFFAQ
jgi:hypothetical protein